jgi:hypothetical protein
MTDLQPMIFDLQLVEVQVRVGGEDYILREANGEAARQYRNAALTGTEMDHDDSSGKSTIRNIQGAAAVESLLVSLCLFYKSDPNKHVERRKIEGWPARVTRQLFDKAKEISQLDETEDLDKLHQQRVKLDQRIERLEKEKKAVEQIKNKSGEGDLKNPQSLAIEDGSQ